MRSRSQRRTGNSNNLGTMGDESCREQVLGDGAKQSGGRRIEVVTHRRDHEGAAAGRRRSRGAVCDLLCVARGTKLDKRFNLTRRSQGADGRRAGGAAR